MFAEKRLRAENGATFGTKISAETCTFVARIVKNIMRHIILYREKNFTFKFHRLKEAYTAIATN